MNVDTKIAGCLAHLRTKSEQARRQRPDDREEGLDYLVDPFMVDGDVKINDSKAFRRLSEKTQVMTGHNNAMIRNRNSHTSEVVSVAVRVASILGLNVNLTRAIALGHDIGHVPLGHKGEEFLSKKLGREFNHEIFGVVLAQKIERLGRGLNLTHQVLSGILNHSRGKGPLVVNDEMSQEAAVVMYADKIAYVTADYNDISKRLDLPDIWVEPVSIKINKLGSDQRERESKIIRALCSDSMELGRVGFRDSEAGRIFLEVKHLMYGIYPKINIHLAEDGLDRILANLEILFGKDKALLFLVMMTDEDVLPLIHKNTLSVLDLQRTAVWEQKNYILGLPEINVFEPGLDW